MKLATIATIAASLGPALANYAPGQGPDWVTYTKNLPKTTVTVTRYEGTSTYLDGPAYSTKTIVVSSDGKALYTEIITGHNNHLDAPQTTEAEPEDGAGEGPDWATYTKRLPKATIVVTRYLGTSTALLGPDFYTRTVIVSSDGKPLYTEIITGHNNHKDPAPTAAPQQEEQKQEQEQAPAAEEEKAPEAESKETETAEESTESTQKSVSASASTSGAAGFGYFLGFVGVCAGAFYYFRRPKNMVLLPHQEV